MIWRKSTLSLLVVLALLPFWNQNVSGAASQPARFGPIASIPPFQFSILAPEYSGCATGAPVPPVINTQFDQQVVELVNQQRLANSLPPLALVDSLYNAARYHAIDMSVDNYFYHETYDRVNGQLKVICDPFSRIEVYYGTNFTSMAENIASGFATPQDAVNAWMGSTGHRANILDADNWETGAGYALSASGEPYWVQDFGSRQNNYPMIINREAAATASTGVTLYIYGNWSQIRLRNDTGSWTGWQTFQNQMSWTLQDLPGERAVSAEMRSGNTTAATKDTIDYVGPLIIQNPIYLPLLIKK